MGKLNISTGPFSIAMLNIVKLPEGIPLVGFLFDIHIPPKRRSLPWRRRTSSMASKLYPMVAGGMGTAGSQDAKLVGGFPGT